MSLSQANKPIRILLADRHSLFRQAVRELLDRQEDLEVVAEAEAEAEVMIQARNVSPDVALIGSNVGDGDALEVLTSMRQLVPGCRVVVIASNEDPGTLLQAVEAGASGYITKECALSDLMKAARSVHRGETLVPPTMLGTLLERLVQRRRQATEARRRLSHLTRRERQVLALLGDGGNKETIARTLVISPETARTHIQNILSKLGVHSSLEAAAFVMQNGVREEVSDDENLLLGP